MLKDELACDPRMYKVDSLRLYPMSSRLDQVLSWNELARRTGYSSKHLARVCGVSQRALQRHFQRVFKLRVNQWLRDLRLMDAAQLLSPAKPVRIVAAQLGYKQPSHFVSDFKKYYGVTPLRYAQKADPNPILEAMFSDIERLPRHEVPLQKKTKFGAN
jgi:AraC-like DNA-binding protein